MSLIIQKQKRDVKIVLTPVGTKIWQQQFNLNWVKKHEIKANNGIQNVFNFRRNCYVN